MTISWSSVTKATISKSYPVHSLKCSFPKPIFAKHLLRARCVVTHVEFMIPSLPFRSWMIKSDTHMEWNEGYHQPGEVPLPHPLLSKSARLHLLLTSNFRPLPRYLNVLPAPAPTSHRDHPQPPPITPSCNRPSFVNTSDTSYLSTLSLTILVLPSS